MHSFARWAAVPPRKDLPFAVQDGLFGAAHAAATELELSHLFEQGHYTRTAEKTFFGTDNIKGLERRMGSAKEARGDATLYVDAANIDQHAELRNLGNVRRVARFMDALRERLGMRCA